jgi:hypothetical protein
VLKRYRPSWAADRLSAELSGGHGGEPAVGSKVAIVAHHAAVNLAPLNSTRALGLDYGGLVGAGEVDDIHPRW